MLRIYGDCYEPPIQCLLKVSYFKINCFKLRNRSIKLQQSSARMYLRPRKVIVRLSAYGGPSHACQLRTAYPLRDLCNVYLRNGGSILESHIYYTMTAPVALAEAPTSSLGIVSGHGRTGALLWADPWRHNIHYRRMQIYARKHALNVHPKSHRICPTQAELKRRQG